MKSISRSILILTSAFAIVASAIFFSGFAYADFQVAYTGAVEEKPAVAYNSNTGKFLVAYLIHTGDHDELRCQLHNADGTKSGGVITPLGAHEAYGRPAVAYNPNTDRFFVAVPGHMEGSTATVLGKLLYGDGSNPYFLAWELFDYGLLYLSSYYNVGEDYNALHVVCNTLLNEFMVTVQLTLNAWLQTPPEYFNVIEAQRILSNGGISDRVRLFNFGHNGISGHAIAYAPIVGTTPAGGRYLFATHKTYGTQYGFYPSLLDSQGNEITEFPLYTGNPEGNSTIEDIAYGEVQGKKRFLLVYKDTDNWKPPYTVNRWTGIWGTYVDPTVTSYGSEPNNSPFPISYIFNHAFYLGARVSYNPNKKAFAVVWREVPNFYAENDESRSHIRGYAVNYFVEDGIYNTSLIPLPAPIGSKNSNVVISDITGTCSTPGDVCLSNEDPVFPDVSATYGSSAVVVWHQQYPLNPDDLDVFGDLFDLPNPPVSSCVGDFDGDNDVDGSDLALFAADFGRTNCISSPPCKGDFDTDGDVDGSDLAAFAADFGRTNCQ